MKKTLILFFIPLLLSGCSFFLDTDRKESPPVKINNNMTNNEISGEKLADKFKKAIIKTNMGEIAVEFYADDSPITVENFLKLAQSDFYDNTKFHRVIRDFMIQGGDPLTKESDARYYGTGGPGYKFKDEINSHKLVRGSLAMANSGPDTNGSQFFIVTAEETSWLDGRHTNFGHVVSGLDVVEKMENVETNELDRPLQDIIVEDIILR